MRSRNDDAARAASVFKLRSGPASWARKAGLLLCPLAAAALVSGCALFESPPEPQEPEAPAAPAAPAKPSGKSALEAERLCAAARAACGGGEICADPERALAYLDEAVRLEPEYAEALVRRGMVLSEQGYAEEAFEDLSKAVRLNPSSDAYACRGLALLRQGNLKGASQDLDEAVRLDPRSGRARNLRGTARLKEGKDEEACEDFEKACGLGDCSFLEKARQEKVCR